ncbi:winged helix-turn-helix domain-containing protein [Vibrio mediterranei]|uniref:winged helix-turn-helix domain-containing protein n=1 Tax=Vibrio TaxID=662 RepID=UPI00406988A9
MRAQTYIRIASLKRKNVLTRPEARVLIYLLENMGETICADTLICECWDGKNRSKSSLAVAVSNVRKALRDTRYRIGNIRGVYITRIS